MFPDTREAGVSSAACCPFMFLSRGIPSSRSSVRFPLGRFCLIGDNRPPVADTGPSSATEAGNTRLRPVRVSWLFAFPVECTRHALTIRRPGPSAAPAPPPRPRGSDTLTSGHWLSGRERRKDRDHGGVLFAFSDECKAGRRASCVNGVPFTP